MVAQLNQLEDARLEAFLFGADRVQTARIRAGLWEIQGCRCFYCDERLANPARGQVDHFRGIYLRLPADARLWLRRREFVDPDGARLAAALAGSS